MQLHTQTISGEVPYDHGRLPRRFARGRVCAEPECNTRLSVYNESEHCALHMVGLMPRVRGSKAGRSRGRQVSAAPGEQLASVQPARASLAWPQSGDVREGADASETLSEVCDARGAGSHPR